MSKHKSSTVATRNDFTWSEQRQVGSQRTICSESLSSPASSSSSSSSSSSDRSSHATNQNSHQNQILLEDYLELNELMYLGGSCCELFSEMSEFSAANLYQQTLGGRRRGRRRPQKDVLEFENCSECKIFEASHNKLPVVATSRGKQIVSSYNIRRPRSLMSRSGNRSLSLVRRPLPIPPPVVPLWKELELLSPQRGEHQQSTRGNKSGVVEELSEVSTLSTVESRGMRRRRRRREGSGRGVKKDLCHLNMETSTIEGVPSNALGKCDRNFLEQAPLVCGSVVAGDPCPLKVGQMEEFERGGPSTAIYDTPELNSVPAVRADCGPIGSRKLTRLCIRPSQPPPPPPSSCEPKEAPKSGCARKLSQMASDTSGSSFEGRTLPREGDTKEKKKSNNKGLQDQTQTHKAIISRRPEEGTRGHLGSKCQEGGEEDKVSEEQVDKLSQVQGFKGSLAQSLRTATLEVREPSAAAMGSHQSVSEQSRGGGGGGGADTSIKLLAPLKAACKSSVWHATKQVNGTSEDLTASATSDQVNKLAISETQDHFDIRRKSLQDGDVFIYPSHYKDSNVCSACGRDFRVCSCNVSPTTTTLTTNGLTQNLQVAKGPQDEDEEERGKVEMIEENGSQVKTVYKISIATASIDQKRNQLRVSSPKIIVASQRTTHQQPSSNQANTCSLIMDTNGSEITKDATLSSPLTAFSMTDTCCSGQTPPQTPQETDRSPMAKAKLTSISIGKSNEHLNAAYQLEHFLSPLVASLTNPTDCNNNNNNSNDMLEVSNRNSQEQSFIEERKEPKSETNERVDIGENYYDKQLTCNLEVGDSIKITSTSMLIEPAEIEQCSRMDSNTSTAGCLPPKMSQEYTSIIPVSTLSARRRHISIKLTSRQAIQASSTDSAEGGSPIVDYHQEPIKCLERSPENLNTLRGSVSICGADQQGASPSSLENSSSDLLEYSPILTSARDYINNVNTNELQVQSSMAMGATGPDNEHLGELPPIQLVSRVPVDANCLLGNDSAALSAMGPINQALGPTGDGTASGALVALSGGVESPKKSIFEGASKAEILEYLEDARERVPEILMAADDVMVINDNELIVVNQLEPGAPATPISIVETVGVINSTSSSDCSQTPASALNLSYLNASDVGLLNQTTLSNETASNMCTSDIQDLNLIINTGEKIDELERFQASQTTMINDQEWPMESLYNNSNNERHTIVESDNQQHKPIAATSSNERQEAGERRMSLLRRRGSGNGGSSFIRNHFTRSNQKSDFGELLPTATRARQNSTSSDGSTNQMSSLQMVRLKQLYTNRNSLSSTSSSPLSSTSPASLTSSNQTSGNCSAASNFYASSSLSCSSPLLAGNAGTTSPGLSRPFSAAIFSPKLLGGDASEARAGKASPESSMIKFLSPSSTKREESAAEKSAFDLLSPTKNQLYNFKSILGCELSTTTLSGLQDEINKETLKLRTPTDNNKCSLSETSVTEVLSTNTNSNNKLDSAIVNDITKLSVIDESKPLIGNAENELKQVKKRAPTSARSNGYTSSADLVSRALHGHYATMNRLNNYLRNRSANNSSPEALVEFQCLDCDQFIDVDQASMTSKSNEIPFLSRYEMLHPEAQLIAKATIANGKQDYNKEKPLEADQLDRAYIAAMNGLPLCKSCEKKRIERKEIISEFVDTELKYGCDLKIIYDEFYRPMQVAGLLSREQINGIFLNLEELMISNRKFSERLQTAINEAVSMSDTYFNILNIGRLFIESSEMLGTFESYCIRQGSAACLLARLAKEKELLRIFLRVSQMENTVLRRMNLAAFLMVPVQRVTRYPLLLNRLYKVTAYHHKDRELLRDAQLKVELHLEHINQQTKGFGATNKIWRRISNLSAPSRRCLINAEDIGYIKLRKTALELLKWDREETQFIHSGKLHFAPLYEFLTKQKAKPLRYMPTHALLIAMGKPNWAYRPDLVKPNFDHKLITPTPGGTGIREVALLLFREKNGRYTPCREPLYLSNCVLSTDCSQFNNECVSNPPKNGSQSSAPNTTSQSANSSANRKSIESKSLNESTSCRSSSAGDKSYPVKLHAPKVSQLNDRNSNSNSSAGDSVSMVSTKSLPEDHHHICASHSSRSNSLASALPKSDQITTTTSKVSSATIINQLMTKVNSYHIKPSNGNKANQSNEYSKKMATSSNCVTPDITRSELSQVNGPKLSTSSVPNSSSEVSTHNYNHLYFHNHLQTYGVYEESFEIHERLTKESMLLRADTPLKTRYWLQMLKYQAKDLGSWRTRRNALPNIMMMRHE